MTSRADEGEFDPSLSSDNTAFTCDVGPSDSPLGTDDTLDRLPAGISRPTSQSSDVGDFARSTVDIFEGPVPSDGKPKVSWVGRYGMTGPVQANGKPHSI